MEQRVFIKKCGRDQLGNTGTPEMAGRPGREFLENEVEVLTFIAQGVHEMREPHLNKKTAKIEYKRSIEEVIADHAIVCADGRPYFIGTAADYPADPEFRGAWFYDDETDPKQHRIGVDMAVAREIQKLRVKDWGSLQIRGLDMYDPDIMTKRQAIINACRDFDVSKIETTAELKNAFPQL